MPAQRSGDTSGQRWAEILAPLIPPTDIERLFIELGCNAGYYVRQARDLGYRAIGVERDPAAYEQACYWERSERKGIQLIQADLLHYDIPANYLTLLACVHYWLTLDELSATLKRLHRRAVNLVVMGKHRGESISPPDRRSLLRRLKGWRVIGETRNRRHYGLLLANPSLYEADTEELYHRQVEMAAQVGGDSDFFPAFAGFVETVISGQEFDHRRTEFYRYLLRHNLRYRETLMEAYAGHVLSARAGGIRRPLAVREDGMVTDGNHRLVIAKVLGIPKVICQRQ